MLRTGTTKVQNTEAAWSPELGQCLKHFQPWEVWVKRCFAFNQNLKW